MAIFSINNTRIAGIAACVPKNEVSNMDYDFTTEKERKLYVKTTGIEKRRVAQKGLTTSDLCFEAAEKLISELDWNKEDIELLVFISQSGDFILPATATILQDRLGLPKTCMAYDVGLGCSGFVYGLSQVSSLVQTGAAKKALLLVGDISTATASYRDKSTFPLFGDAATATAIEYKEESSPIHFNLMSDGSGYDAIIIPDGGLRNFINEDSFKEKKYGEGIYRTGIQVALDGIKVFTFSQKEVVPNIRALVETTLEKSLEEMDYFVLHQANLLMNNSIRRKMKLEKEKFPLSIDRFGNTSSASIPLTIVTELREELQSKEANMLLCGFGVGLSWGSVQWKADKIVIPELIEI
ncbi:MAG: ketoacyl-ACP synthase III [Bacteroidales bacterium]|nr:ketoacyl-ACP synthase III [Bacteroidales bacterium]